VGDEIALSMMYLTIMIIHERLTAIAARLGLLAHPLHGSQDKGD
jgi:hypothetical protein